MWSTANIRVQLCAYSSSLEFFASQEERHINMTLYGTPHGFTAMAQTVGKPTAIAAKMILSGEINRKGIVRPTTSDIYRPILEHLAVEGIQAAENSKII